MPESSSRSPRFATTCWSVVLSAREKSSPESAAALERLCRDYWYPLYAFARRCGHAPHDAQDLTQAFFVRLLEKDWLRPVEREGGRFRTFLILALKRFLANEWDRARAQKRGGAETFVELDAAVAESRYLAEPAAVSEADRLYERRWALTLLERTMARLRAESDAGDGGAKWDGLKSCLTAGRGEIDYAALARDTGLTEGAARVAVHRLRKRFREIFREVVADTVAEPGEVESEMRHVAEILGKA